MPAQKQNKTDNDIRALQSEEVDRNGEIFRKIHLPKLIKKHRNKHALLKNGEVAGIFPDRYAAIDEGEKRYEDGIYSVQRIIDRPLRLGSRIRVIRE